MPYINQKDRDKFKYGLQNLKPRSTGELNYLFTMLIQQYFKEVDLDYGSINDVMGALEGAKLEFYRRVAAKYEDEKINKHGDVY